MQKSDFVLYMGCLPKIASLKDIQNYIDTIDPTIRVKLATKNRGRESRGHGKLICPDRKLAQRLLSMEHYFGGKKIIVEKVKNSKELKAK